MLCAGLFSNISLCYTIFMAFGLAALLDDIALLAKAAASSLDDIAAGTAKASSKAVAVVVDDTAVTPQYVKNISPSRELPIIKKIALGSLKNKGIILIFSHFLSATFPWILTPLLMLGGMYLVYEASEKILSRLLHTRHTTSTQENPQTEDDITSSAIRTDFILSTEIMVIALNEVTNQHIIAQAFILIIVALLITLLVYGTVALIVKMDDIGIAIAKRSEEKSLRNKLGTSIVKFMPILLSILTIIGVAAMLWVGGHLIINGLDSLGIHALHHFAHYVASLSTYSTLSWIGETSIDMLIGFLIGSLLALFIWSFSRIILAKRHEL